MDLYDDDVDVTKEDVKVAGWSTGIRLMTNQMQLKKATQTPKSRELSLKNKPTLAPVIDFNKKNKKEAKHDAFPFSSKPFYKGSGDVLIPLEPKVEREYDPLWPNEYEKVVKEIKSSLKRSNEDEDGEEYAGGKRPYIARNQILARKRFNNFNDTNPTGFSGFGSQPMLDSDDFEPEKEADRPRAGGIAIAPPPSLTESSASPPPSNLSNSSNSGSAPVSGMDFAQKLMAKYGYKEGTGLGKNKQGITKSLQVEKTSRRGGRIINEDLEETTKTGGAAIPPPTSLYGSLVADYGAGDDNDNENENEYGAAEDEYGSSSAAETAASDPTATSEAAGGGGGGGDEFKAPFGVSAPGEEGFKVPAPPSFNDPFKAPLPPVAPPPRPSVTELIKNPTRIVLMKNMVGPGEVDEELEPEVKDECETKYGEILSVKILEKSHLPDHEAVQIYIEFKRIECAIKALVDLNGRFFGGREVQAAFFDEAKFEAGQL